MIMTKMNLNFISTNFHKLLLFEYYFINNLFKNKTFLQKCSKLLFYIYFRIVIFMYFSFNQFYSKFICSYLIIQYLFIYLVFTFNILYFNIYNTDNLLLFNNILLDNYSIFENINFDINSNHDLNKDFNVLYFDNNKYLIPYNNNGNDNNMNNMNNMNNNNNFDDTNIFDISNKSNNNNEQESDIDTITLFNRIIHLKKTNPLIFDMIINFISDNDNNNNILQEESLSVVKNNTINDNNINLLPANSNLLPANSNLSLNNIYFDNSKVTNNFMEVVKPVFEDNSSKVELKMPCRIIGPYAHMPILYKTGTMLSLPFYNGTPTLLERLSFDLNGTLPDDYDSFSTKLLKNTIKQDELDLIKLENKSHFKSLFDFSDLSVSKNAVASSSKIEELSEFSFAQGSSNSNSNLLSNSLNFLPDEIFLSHILTIQDPNRTDIQPFIGGFDIYGNIHLPMEVLDHYTVPDYLLLNYNCYAQYDSDLHPVLFQGMLEEAWKNLYLDTIIEFYLEDHNMYKTYYTKDNLDVIIEFLKNKINNSNTPTINTNNSNTFSTLDKGKSRAF